MGPIGTPAKRHTNGVSLFSSAGKNKPTASFTVVSQCGDMVVSTTGIDSGSNYYQDAIQMANVKKKKEASVGMSVEKNRSLQLARM